MIPLKDTNPTERFPIMTVLLIALNVAVFAYEVMLGERSAEQFLGSFALVPERLFHPSLSEAGPVPAGATLISSMFLHGGPVHLAGNMLYLWIFGNNIEDAMGRGRYVVFYLLCGVAASLAHALTDTRSVVPMIGASGAVSGVLGGYLLLYPRARVLTLFSLGFFVRLIEVPAVAVLGFWFVFQFLNAIVVGVRGGGVAWFAHLGGFLAGMALIGLFKRRHVPFWGRRR